MLASIFATVARDVKMVQCKVGDGRAMVCGRGACHPMNLLFGMAPSNVPGPGPLCLLPFSQEVCIIESQ